MAGIQDGPTPEGVVSLLDTDLYKLTMQSAVLKYFPTSVVTYGFTNRTPEMKLSRDACQWLQQQIDRLGNLSVSQDELEYLRETCPYLSAAYLSYLETFKLNPAEQVKLTFKPLQDTGSGADKGEIELVVRGLWLETILYEIPLLALTSEAYFKFCDRDWTHDGQVEKAEAKGLKLAENGCLVSEFGSRRRRDYQSHEMVIKGLVQANEKAAKRGYSGKVTGTSNVYLAKKFGIAPIGTVAHEWFMGVAALTDNYLSANEAALTYWVGTFGKGVLGIALTDTFGTPAFLQAFAKSVPAFTAARGAAVTIPSANSQPGLGAMDPLASTTPPLSALTKEGSEVSNETFAQVFSGVRQDSGEPEIFIKRMRDFYDEQQITQKKTIVFSDSLNSERCIELKQAAEAAGFLPSFGVGTFFTNDFTQTTSGQKSVPMNIVIKLSSAEGRPAVKISDNLGKNTGDSQTVKRVKEELGYQEREWTEGNEAHRWDG